MVWANFVVLPKPDNPTEGSLLNADIFRFNCLCALPANHFLARKSAISSADLQNVPIASLFSNHPTRKESEQAFATAGMKFNPQYETNHFIMLLSFVQEGLACAIVDPLTAESYKLFSDNSKKVVFLPLMMDITFSVEKLTPGFRPASILAKSFDEYLQNELLRLGGDRVDLPQDS